MNKSLFFDYPSTSRIKILRKNCYYNEEFPCLYGIMTAKLSFTIPRVMTMFSIDKKYVYIPLDYYKQVLTNYYKSINYEAQ